MSKGGGATSWFIGSALASMVAAFIAVRLFDHIFSSAADGVASVGRAGVFAGTWTTVTTKLGMRTFGERIQRLRRHTRDSQD